MNQKGSAKKKEPASDRGRRYKADELTLEYISEAGFEASIPDPLSIVEAVLGPDLPADGHSDPPSLSTQRAGFRPSSSRRPLKPKITKRHSVGDLDEAGLLGRRPRVASIGRTPFPSPAGSPRLPRVSPVAHSTVSSRRTPCASHGLCKHGRGGVDGLHRISGFVEGGVRRGLLQPSGAAVGQLTAGVGDPRRYVEPGQGLSAPIPTAGLQPSSDSLLKRLLLHDGRRDLPTLRRRPDWRPADDTSTGSAAAGFRRHLPDASGLEPVQDQPVVGSALRQWYRPETVPTPVNRDKVTATSAAPASLTTALTTTWILGRQL